MRHEFPFAGATVAILLASAGLTASLSASAKPMEEIAVGAPQKVTIGRTTSGIPIEQITVRSVVHYGDLDLSTRAGADELEQRIRDAARTSCHSIDLEVPVDRSSDRSCIKHAVDDAMLEARTAIATERIAAKLG